MAEALTLKVDKNQFQETLDRLRTVLENLEDKRSQLQNIINRMSDTNFGGSDTAETVRVAREALRRVENAIIKVEAQREIIERALTGTESSSQTLISGAREVEQELPDIFS